MLKHRIVPSKRACALSSYALTYVALMAQVSAGVRVLLEVEADLCCYVIYIYIYIYTHMYIYIYIYVERERDNNLYVVLSLYAVCLDVYVL